ncbi:hypothetical protein STREPTOSP366_25190, partial [Streptomyces variabilis]
PPPPPPPPPPPRSSGPARADRSAPTSPPTGPTSWSRARQGAAVRSCCARSSPRWPRPSGPTGWASSWSTGAAARSPAPGPGPGRACGCARTCRTSPPI